MVKKNVLFRTIAVITLAVVSAGGVFAQDSDDEYINVAKTKQEQNDTFLGFRLGITQDLTTSGSKAAVGPGIALGYHRWMQKINDKLSLGPAVRASVGFIDSVEVSMPDTSNMNNLLDPSKTTYVDQKIDWSSGAILVNIDGLAGYGLKAQFNDVVGVTVKGGLAFNADVAVLDYKILFTPYTYHQQIGYYRLGLGFDAGLRISPVKSLPVYAELGFGLSINFVGFSQYDSDLKKGDKSSKEWTKEDFQTEVDFSKTITGKVKSEGLLSLGAPYFLIGYRF